MLKKFLIITFILLLSISQTNAWLGLIAENNDLLNIGKWNEFVNLKLSRSDLKAGNNISLTNSGSEIYINKGISVAVPYLSTTTQVEIPGDSTTTITLEGENFESGSIVTIPGLTVNSVNVISPIEIEVNLTTGNTIGTFDVVVENNGKLNTLWTNNGEDLISVISVEIVGDDASGRKWTNGKIAKTCDEYRHTFDPYSYSGNTGNGIYLIKPDSNPEFKVYCDMTTNSGGWTRFVNIKGDYTKQNAIDCWLGTNINNTNLECFNPNRYSVQVGELLNIDWSGTYTYSMIDSNASVTTESSRSSRKCLGHDEYMTIMRANQTPKDDGSDTSYVRLARSFCKYSRDPAGRGGSFMNYDSSGDFGESSSAARESNARDTKIYFR